MPLSHSEKLERLKISGILHEKFGLTIALLAQSRFYAASQEYGDTRMSHSRSLGFFCF